MREATIITALWVFLSSAGLRAEPMRDATAWLNAAYQLKASGDLGGAVEALRAARAAGAEPQRIALELAYTHLALGQTGAARDELVTASRGPNAELAEQARTQLAALPGAWWADVYVESFGWRRMHGAVESTDLVPTVRVRGMRRLASSPELNVYVFAQATRDTSSRGLGAATPQIYADDRALAGGGGDQALAGQPLEHAVERPGPYVRPQVEPVLLGGQPHPVAVHGAVALEQHEHVQAAGRHAATLA